MRPSMDLPNARAHGCEHPRRGPRRRRPGRSAAFPAAALSGMGYFDPLMVGFPPSNIGVSHFSGERSRSCPLDTSSDRPQRGAGHSARARSSGCETWRGAAELDTLANRSELTERGEADGTS